MAHILTLNAGSSSLKFGLFAPGAEPQALATGLVERIGAADGQIKLKAADGTVLAQAGPAPLADHGVALEQALAMVQSAFPGAEIDAVGHRVVHGGPDIGAPQPIDEALIAELERYNPFAPLHQPHNLAGVRAAMGHFPDARQIACFDTAFHRHHPWEEDAFALPLQLYREGVRRYGFHGLSYDFIAGHLAQTEPKLAAGRVIVAHLGNGASMCGLKDGRSVASTMGFSALDGLPMGSRSGQLDPGVLLYLLEQKGMGAAEITELLYKKSGLLGLSELSNDMRTLEEAGTEAAENAIAYFCARIRRETGALAAALGGIDGLVFTAGIGENSARVRAQVCAGMEWLGIEIDAAANAAGARVISTAAARIPVLVIPTNEELVIARAAAAG